MSIIKTQKREKKVSQQLLQTMAFIRFHCAMRRMILADKLPTANRSKDATERSIAMKSLNYHSREGYKLCLQARAMLRK